jgi:pantoate--beta-alanine ligase
MSSRNQYLTQEERAIAPEIHATLKLTVAALRGGRRDFSVLETEGARKLSERGFKMDYYAVRRAFDLLPAAASETDFVVLTAARLGKARLIDNVCVRID